ncbi:MAG: hypothetical protein KDB61_08685 [Planctomycetes bacterium]|nr:hypothetical protein [Planctomycetota bacterium]
MFSKLFGKKPTYQFPVPKTQACITCCHVTDSKAPILHVTHDAHDGGWQFLCGADGHGENDARVLSMLEIVTLDPSVNALHEMPAGVGAEREAVGAEWKPFRAGS